MARERSRFLPGDPRVEEPYRLTPQLALRVAVLGFLVDIANLGTLGFTSLLLTVAGFWIGRYGETTAHDRFHAPYLSVLVVTVLYAFGALVLRFVLGDAVPAHEVVAALPAEVLWNLLLTWPLYGLVRRLFPPSEMSDRAYEVRLLG